MKIKLLTLVALICTGSAFAQEKKFENPDADSRGYLVKVGDKAPDYWNWFCMTGLKPI